MSEAVRQLADEAEAARRWTVEYLGRVPPEDTDPAVEWIAAAAHYLLESCRAALALGDSERTDEWAQEWIAELRRRSSPTAVGLLLSRGRAAVGL